MTTGSKHRHRLRANGQVESLEARMLLAADAQLIAISPNDGSLLQEGVVLDVAPTDLTFRFAEGDGTGLDESLIAENISISRAGNDGIFTNGNEVTITPGYIGIGESNNEAIVRFAETLPDDLYQVDAYGKSMHFRLDLGAKIVAVVPQPVDAETGTQARDQIVVYFNNDDLDPASAEDPGFYKLVNTNDTVTNTDDGGVHSPIDVDYDADADRATLTFAADIDVLSGAGTYRLRIGTDERRLDAPQDVNLTAEPGSSFSTAFNLDVLQTGKMVSAAIEAQEFPLDYPGDNDSPGHRDLSYHTETHLLAKDETAGISTIAYMFRDVYGEDPDGVPLRNLITEPQKERVREITSLFSYYAGVQFIEADEVVLDDLLNQGISVFSIATGDLRAVDPLVPTGPGGVIGIAGSSSDGIPTAVMDAAETWDDDYGENWFETAMHEIGHLLGLGHTYDLPPGTVMGNYPVPFYTPEPVFPGDHDVVHTKHLYRPESTDIDMYRFELQSTGLYTAETFAERQTDASLLDTVLSVFRENEDGSRELIARNDDYFSNDSFVELTLEPGVYFIGVSASGNDDYDADVHDSGNDGRSQGVYDLRMNFRPQVTSSIVDKDRTPFDGNADGVPGGVFNFWFRAESEENTIFVDKSAPSGGTGRLDSPLNNLQTALTQARSRATADNNIIVRVLGNEGADSDSLIDNQAYEIGFDAFNRPLADGSTIELPSGVTMMVDEGAIFKLRRARIGVGSSTPSVDRSQSALQILGVPDNNVIFTSINDETIGTDNNPLPTTAAPGDWGGILFQNDVDRSEGRFEYEQKGIFLNYVNHADIRYGGGEVVLESVLQIVTPIQMVEARPSLSYNFISQSADAAMSADPNSFEETNFHSPFYQDVPFTSDYTRIGPDVHDNTLSSNSLNGLFVSIGTSAGQEAKALTVSGRWDDQDIVHIVAENLVVQGTPGGPIHTLAPAPGVLSVFATPEAGGGLPEGSYNYRMTFVQADGSESSPSGPTVSTPVIGRGNQGTITLSNLPRPDAFSGTTGIKIYRSTAGAAGPYTLVADLPIAQTSFTDNGTISGGAVLDEARADVTARLDARLSIDPGIVVKLDAAHIDVQLGGQLIAEGRDGAEIIFTSTRDDRYGAGSTFDTNNDNEKVNFSLPKAGDWGGIFVGQMSSASIANGFFAYGGGVTKIEGTFTGFNTIEVHQAEARIVDSVFVDNADGTGGQGEAVRTGRGFNASGTIFVRGAQPIIVDNVIRSGEGAAINVNPNALNREWVSDPGRMTGFVSQIDDYGDNQGPLVRGNLLDGNAINGMIVRGEILTTQSVWDDTDIVHVVLDEVIVPDHHESGGLRLESSGAASLVVKLSGSNAGLTATGREIDNDDRAGGSLQVIGQPGFPVVLTSLRDDSVGAGFNAEGRTLTDTDNNGNRSDAEGSLPRGPEVTNGTTIDNDVLATTPGSLGIIPGDGGNVLSTIATIQTQNQILQNQNLITQLANYVDVGGNGGAFNLANTNITLAPTLLADDAVVSEGFFLTGTAPNVQRVNWRAETSIEDGETTIVNKVTFSTEEDTDTLGNIRVVNFLDQDVAGPGGDILVRQGDTLSNDFRAFVFDDVERIGFGHGGAVNAAGGLVNAEFRGWAADLSNVLLGSVLGPGNAYTANGAIDPINLPEIDDDQFARVNGPGDIATAFAWDVVGGAKTSTIVSYTQLVARSQSSLAGDWRGIRIDEFAHDRNVDVASEQEPLGQATNNIPNTAQFLGELAPFERGGDDNRRLGFQVTGHIDSESDMDVYSFRGTAGTEAWLDIDRTDSKLDSIIELVDANGVVLARSDDSNAESAGDAVVVGVGRSLDRSVFDSTDRYTTNVNDAGMRVVLPGANGTQNTYHVRVRSRGASVNSTSDGLTTGSYELQIRLREADEVPGTTVRFADIRNAVNGIEILGQPAHSPLLGETGETTADNDTRANAQPLGNVIQSDRGAIVLTGSFSDQDDLDWYQFDAILPSTQRITAADVAPEYVAVTFDVDFTDGFGRPNTAIWIYDEDGNLVYSSEDSAIADDRPAQSGLDAVSDLTAGSVGAADPFLGTVELREGTYFMAVTSERYRPSVLTEDPLLRAEPINSLIRIAEDRIGYSGGSNIPEGPIVPILFTDDFSIIPAQPSEIQDGESFIITNENGESVTYEFDSNGIVDGTNVPVTFDPTIDFLLGGFFTGTVSSTLQAVINANGPAGVTAGFGSVPDEVTLTGARGVKTNAAPNGNPSSLFVSKPSNTPFRLGDVTLFVTQDSGRDQTRLITVDPYTGTQETTVGIFDANVEDIAIRPTGFLHGFSVTEQDPNIGNLGNYWQIDPRSQATQALGANLGDDGITTWWIDPANPGAPAQVDDGVIFQAITLGGGIRDGLTGFAVGHRGLIDPNGVAGPTRNLLYEFNVDTGAAQNADGSQDRADVELVQGGGTQIRERGQLDLFVDPFGFGNTSLSIPEVTIINTAGQTVPFVTDGLQFTLDDGAGNSFNFEFNSGPEVQYQHTPGADIYVRDGDTFLLDGNAFEFDTGSVVVVTAENGNGIADGDTLTITDNQVPPVTRTFEFDDGSGGPIGAGNVRLTFDSSFNQQAIINTIVNGINAVGNFNIDAQQLAATNRISLLGESNVLGAVSTSSGMIIQGTPGGSGALVHVEEVMDSVEFGAAVSADVPGASAEGTRMNFSGYTTADFRQIASRGVFQQVLTSDGDVTPGFIGIDFLAAESGNQTAVRAAAVVNASTTMTATSLGGALVVNAPASVTFAQDPLRIGGTAPGGDITGLAIVNGSIYGVTAPGPDGGGGGLYRIVSPLSNFAVADYIETATDLLTGGRDQFGNPTGGPIEFAALSAGPDNIYDGEYAELLFAMDVFGNMYAFDLEGNLQPVFLDSNSSVSTGITNATGFAFSTLDMNLWHPTSERRNDAGHGYNRPQDLSRIAEPQGGNSSLYFGFGNPQNTPGNWGGVNDPGNRNNYDFPGGAHGSIESNTFDLSDYSPIDSPALFFNYFLETDEGIGDAGPPPFMTDSFRVFVSADDGEWQLLATNNSFRANGTADDEYDYGGLVTVQEALDNVGWRQMQVDLSPLAGERNVRLRFDFNSAGAFDLGNPLTGGVELRAIDADQISDGDALVLNDGTFEFDFGYMLLAPTGSSVTDGETFEVNDGVNLPVNYEFDLGDGVRPGNVPISYNTGMSSAELAVAIESGILAGFGDGLVQLDLTREDNDVFSDAGRHGLGAGTVVANGSIGDNPILFGANAGRDVDFIELNLTAGQRVTIDVDTDPSSFTSLASSHIRLFDTDGVQVAANANGAAPGEPLFTSDSYLDFTAPGGGIYYLGVSGGGNVNYDPQVAGSGGQGATGDYRVEITMFGVDSDVAIRRSNAVLDLDNVVNLTLGQNSSLQVLGTPGTNFGTPINLDITMSDDQVAWAVRTAIATEFGSGDPNGIPGYGDVVQLLGHTVINPGPLGVSATGFFDEDELPGFSFDIEGLDGDIFGAFDASTLQNGATNANFPGAIRGWNNDFEGVYIDDIVIGFAERGLMYTDVDGGNDQFTQIPIRDTRPNILVGDYTIEIRPSEYYGVFTAAGADIELALTEAFDPRDRFTDGVTLNVAPGAQISDGTTISIGDGSNEVLFEFEDRTLGNGIRRNHVAVPYSNLDSSAVVANTLAATINSLLVQREIDVRAETPTGSNRIELFGNAVVNPNTGARTGLVTEPSDTISTAISSGVGIDGGQRFTALGTIGDNTEIGAGLDVDFLSFSLEAGDEVNIDVDSLDVPVDTMLNLFDANGTLLAASDDDPGPGEQPSLEPFISFTATTAGEYFVGISGFSNRDYDPNVIGSGIAVQNLGDYKVEVSVGGSEEILEVLVSDRRGDANPFRDQGQVIIDSARVTNSSGFGILIDEGARDAEDLAPHQGTPRVLFNTNEERLFTGVTVKNNVVAFNREGGIRYSGDPGNAGEPLSPVSFGRIVNNTIVGGGAQVISGIRDNSPSGIGIQVDENSSPTLLNNIITNFQIGIAVDATSQSTVIGATLFKDNLANSNKGLGQDAILLSSNDPLFVNGEEGNFYLDENSMAIDSSINSVADRSNYSNLTSKLGSPVSPILAPDYDITGLLRVDDPRVDTPAGQGENVFKDRGAIDRADFIGPQAVLINPQDNDVDGKDLNPGSNIVQINNPVMRSFQIQLQDGITESQTQRGAGIDETTVTIDSVTVMQNGTVLTEGVDYLFSYDSASRVIQLTPLSGIWQPGRVYEIEINNSADGGIRDKASNLLQPNTDLGLTRFTISIGGEEQDFGDAPAQYPTELLNNGASHVIQSGVFLGSRIDRESDGTPSTDASADAGDDGVEFESSLVPGRDAEIVVTASRAGKLNAWIDFNMDGDWNDGGEQVLTDADTVAGANTYSIAVPAGNSLAATFARFRFNTEGGLTPTGLALDGEVEDYQVDIVSATPWQNPSEPMDVTSDGNVVPMDVLRIINELNNRTIVSANGRLPNPPVAPNGPEQLGYLDVDGDGFVSPRDALLIINRLNAANDAEGEFDPHRPLAAVAVVGSSVDAPEVRAALEYSDQRSVVRISDVLRTTTAFVGADEQAASLEDASVDSLFESSNGFDEHDAADDLLSDVYDEKVESI